MTQHQKIRIFCVLHIDTKLLRGERKCQLKKWEIVPTLILQVISMLRVQLQINHESLPKERKIFSECEARGFNSVL